MLDGADLLNMSERPEGVQGPNPEKEDGHNVIDNDRSDNNPFADDELETWLQYPLDDNFGRGYCSDVFRHWPPPLTTTTTTTTTTAAHQETGYGVEKAASSTWVLHRTSGSSSKSMGNAAGIATDDTMKSFPRTKHAEEALAIGAGRAAGFLSQSGVEAFTRVRTSLQPREPKLGSPSSFGVAKSGAAPPPCRLLERSPSLPLTSSMLPPKLRTFGSYGGSMLSSPPASSSQGGKSLCRALSSENLDKKHCPKGPHIATSSEQSLLKSSTTALDSEGKRITNAINVHPTKVEHVLGCAVRADPVTVVASGSDVNDSGADKMGSDSFGRSRLSSASFPLKGKKVDESGGSQTSESNKEATASGKRKFEDSECRSEDAEGESAETKNSQARTSTSKRTRAAETHNLSERRRRDRINEKMKALQELIPNSNKTDKASVLDEAIEYLKMLQLQLQMMSMRSGVSLSPMVLPSGLPHMQIPQLEPFHPVGMGMTGGPSGAGAGMGQNVGLGMMDMTYGVPARPLISLPSLSAPANPAFRPQSAPTLNSSISHFQALTTAENLPVYFPHSHLQMPSQSIPSVNMDMYNTYLQQQQQLQQLQRLHPHDHQHQQQQPQQQQPSQQQQQHGHHFQK